MYLRAQVNKGLNIDSSWSILCNGKKYIPLFFFLLYLHFLVLGTECITKENLFSSSLGSPGH